MNSGKFYFEFDSNVISEYVETINFSIQKMSELKKDIDYLYKKIGLIDFRCINELSFYDNIDKKYREQFKKLKSIFIINSYLEYFSKEFPSKKIQYVNELIKRMMDYNNGIISTRMIEPLNISRWYLYHLLDEKKIERISRGIYASVDIFEDSFYTFQYKYKKAIFSHMNALYFYDMTEEIPYTYTVTVPKKYNVKNVKSKCNVFYVDDEIYNLGICEVETPSGNRVKSYDMERCICDIVRSKNRMNWEQVKKSIKQYVKRKDKDINKLSEYSRKMGINEQVMEYVEMFYE